MRKGKKSEAQTPAAAQSSPPPLIDVARTIGSTLGAAAAKTESVAKEIGALAHAVSKKTATTSRRIFERAQKTLRARNPRSKSHPKKKASAKRQPAKRARRRK